MIYLDNAATSGKKPAEVRRAVMHSLKDLSANPGRGGNKLSLAAAEAVYKARERVSDFFGASGPEKVAFTANCTHALNFVIKGVLEKNDHVVVSDLEHNAVMRPLRTVTENISVAEVSLYDDEKTAENFRKCIKDETKLVIATAASNVVGKILPVKEIGKICREKGVLFLVDGAQGGGVIPIDMKEMHIDYLCLAPHKGLYAPMGSGILIAEKNINRTTVEGGNGADSLSLYQKTDMPQGFESGTVGLPAIAGISGGLGFIGRIGREKIYAKESKLVNYLFERLKAFDNIVLYAPAPAAQMYAPVISFNVSGVDSEETAAILDKNGIAVRAGFHCSAAAHRKLGTTDTGTVRVSPSFFNNKEEIDFLCETLKKI